MKTKAPTGQGTQAQDALRRRHLQVTDSRSLVRTSQATVRPRLPHQLCPGFFWAGRPSASSGSRTGLSGWQAAEDTGQGQPVSAVSPAVPAPHFLQETASVPLPRMCQESSGSERVQRATVLSPQLHHLCNICLVTSKARFLRKLVVCLAITQGGRINTQPAITGCTAWGPTSAAPAPHLRGVLQGPPEKARQGPHTRTAGRGGGDFTSGITLPQREEMES